MGKSIVSGTPRERFDALCSHMKKGENRHSSVKGVPLLNPETGEQYLWKKSFSEGSLIVRPLVDGLINADHEGINLSDVCKLLDSSLSSCDAGVFKRSIDGNSLQEYVYIIEIPENMRIENINNITVTIRIQKEKVNARIYRYTHCFVRLQIYTFSVAYDFHMDGAFSEFVQTLKKLANPEGRPVRNSVFWDALKRFSEKCSLIVPFEDRYRSKSFLAFLFKYLVYTQNYPFFFGLERGHEAKFKPVFFRASFVDKCLVP